MSRRISIRQDADEDEDVDVIARSSSRLRALHYCHQRHQRASADILPLISQSQRAARDSLLLPPSPSPPSPTPPPPRPPPTYQPQPHQLIAVCFNHMAGRQCEHCQRLSDYNGQHERMEGSPDSGKTLDPRQQRQSIGNGRDDAGMSGDGGEKGGAKEPPAPVSIWDKQLSKLRLQVFGLWARTSQLHEVCGTESQSLTIAQL